MTTSLRTRAWTLVVFLALTLLTSRRAQAGYDHYWQWARTPEATRVQAAIADMRIVAASRRDLVVFVERPGSISINGIGDGAHEDFEFPGAFRTGKPDDQRAGFNATKTQWKPYDAVVTACLLVARAHFRPDDLVISSDGEDADWDAGREVYSKALGRAPPSLPLETFLDQEGPRVPGARSGRWLFALPGLLYSAVSLYLAWLVWTRIRDGSSTASYYAVWFLVPVVLSTFMARPYLLVIVPIAIVLRPWLPDPVLWVRTSGRIRALERQVLVNPANITARRDLAKLWLARRRGKKALKVVDEALARDATSAELHFLRGLALQRVGDLDGAIPEFAEAVNLDPRFGYGEPYLRCGEVLMAQQRWEDAEDALERFVDIHVSNVEGWYKLARVRQLRGDRVGARKALMEARSGYRFARGAYRRRYLGWYLRAVVRSVGG
ncbi:MAG: tetratricopeptide repeat protein [Polyangiales bacterium]